MSDFYKSIGKINNISSLVYGTAIPPMLYAKDFNEQLDVAFSCGITTFDTARNYGGSEISLGKWLKDRNIRDRVVIISKCAHHDNKGKRVNERAIRDDFAVSQEYLHTNCIDIYMLHRDDTDVPVGEVVEIMNALKREGKIMHFGGSNWTTERIKQANAYATEHGLTPFTVSSPNFSLARQIQDPWGGGCATITGTENEYQRNFYRSTQMPVFAYSSLGRGFFSGCFSADEKEKAKTVLDSVALKAYDSADNYQRLARCEQIAKLYGVTVSQVALRWIFACELNVFAIVSMPDKKFITANQQALEIPLTDKQSKYLNLESEDYE